MIKLDNISYWYRGRRKSPVLHNFTEEIKQGEFIVLSGKNGSGKSTLARIIAGITKPKKGCLRHINTNLQLQISEDVCAENIYARKNFLKLRKKISIVFQNPENNLLFDKIYDDIAFGLDNLKIPKELHAEIIATALRDVGLEGFESRSTYELSGGQKQRVAIAGILAMDCDIIVADEITSMLDSQGKKDIYDLLLKLNNDGKTIILATHNPDEKGRGRIIEL